MPLSEREQQMLEQMERALYAEDPKFATQMKSSVDRRAQRTRWLIGGVGVAAGLALVLLGVNTTMWVGALGFALMVAAAAYAVTAPRPAQLGAVQADGSVRASTARKGRKGATAARRPGRASSGGFMQRLEQRWDRRRDDNSGW
ncbi:MAG: DUF3040 domain-containing protein [Micrococcales bacterium]|nr:DUF3040 domain-containing protein [Micrococcales bacterium]